MIKVYSHAEIRALLEHVTPGVWTVQSNEVYQREHSRSRKPIVTRPDWNGLADAAFIAAAPDIVRQLLAENENAATVTAPSQPKVKNQQQAEDSTE